MSINVTVNSNASTLAAILGGVAKTQIPYATTRALNDLAFDSAREVKSRLGEILAMRNPFSQSGIQINKAEKGTWPKTFAEVGIEERRSYLIDHVMGAKRKGNAAHGRAVLVDTDLRNARGRIPKGKRPSALIKRKRSTARNPASFLIKSGKSGNDLLVRRVGDQRYPLEILYAFNKNVTIKREFEMDLIIQQEVNDNYQSAFAKALNKAIKTAK
jgi:hypothetical protein